MELYKKLKQKIEEELNQEEEYDEDEDDSTENPNSELGEGENLNEQRNPVAENKLLRKFDLHYFGQKRLKSRNSYLVFFS